MSTHASRFVFTFRNHRFFTAEFQTGPWNEACIERVACPYNPGGPSPYFGAAAERTDYDLRVRLSGC